MVMLPVPWLFMLRVVDKCIGEAVVSGQHCRHDLVHGPVCIALVVHAAHCGRDHRRVHKPAFSEGIFIIRIVL
jgi:hypothetical protein